MKWNISDYISHTLHLDELEDIAYRRMLEWCYLHEKPLPSDIDAIARSIRMRTECDRIESVLLEFFTELEDGYYHNRVTKEVAAYQEKSRKAAESAAKRWGNS